MNNKKSLNVMVISDGTGETAFSVAKAAISQFKKQEINFTRYKNIRTIERVEMLLHGAILNFDIVLYTIAKRELRSKIKDFCEQNNIRSVDIIGPTLDHFAEIVDHQEEFEPGLLHSVDEDYFKRVEAIEFTIEHDNAHKYEDLNEADIILLGISRTSKTPLSVYLSLKGVKVINIAIKANQKLPKEVFTIDQNKIFALTTRTDQLAQVRSGLQDRKSVKKKESDFADIDDLSNEIEWAEKLFAKNPKWPIFDVSNKSLEDVASDILKLYYMRKQNKFKQDQRLI